MTLPTAVAALVPGLTLGSVARPGRQLRWLTAGHGDPPILVVPGAGETALDWLPVLPSIASLSTVVVLDRAGLGFSDASGHLTIRSQVDDLAAVLEQIGPAVLVGHSWGGLLVQLVGWQHPSAVAGLVLVDPSHEDLFASMPWPLRIASAALGPATMLAHALGQFPRLARPAAHRLAARCTADPERQAAIERAYLASYARADQVRMIGRENRLAERSHQLVRQARAQAVAPDVATVILTASTGKPAALQRRAVDLHAEVAAALPKGRQVMVNDCGHYIHHDRPDAVVDAIAAVLTEVVATSRLRNAQPAESLRIRHA
jgi:pimeloyl-ACP methyl ester carboxylesterase